MSSQDRMPRDAAGERFAGIASPPTAVLVLGVHRSGTSVLSRMLCHLGVHLGQSRAAPWEHAEVLRVHEELLAALGSRWDDPRPLPVELLRGEAARPFRNRLREIVERDFSARPLWGLKDPRLCRLIPLWRDLLAEIGHEVRFALTARPSSEVAASLRMRDGLEEPRSRLVWLEHLLAAERDTRGTHRAFLTYDGLLRDWRASVARLTRILGLDREAVVAAADGIDAFLDPALRHHREEARLCEPEHPWLRATYLAWEEAADGTDPGPALTVVRDRLDAAGRLLFPWTDHLVAQRDELREELAERNERITQLRARGVAATSMPPAVPARSVREKPAGIDAGNRPVALTPAANEASARPRR